MEIEKNLEEEIRKIDDKIKDCEENLGDVEIRDAILEKATIYLNAGQKEKAIEIYELA